MRFLLLLFSVVCLPLFAHSSSEDQFPSNPYAAYFDEAYQRYPQLQRGSLEAIAFVNTRFQHLDASTPESCTGMPRAWSVMGLIEDGKNWFTPNLLHIAETARVNPAQIKSDARTAILAYAAAMQQAMKAGNKTPPSAFSQLSAMILLNELPIPFADEGESSLQKSYVQDVWLYAVFRFLTNPEAAIAYHFTPWNLSGEQLFGDNLQLMTASQVTVSRDHAPKTSGYSYQRTSEIEIRKRFNTSREQQPISPIVLSPDYGPALWNPAASCNYSSRNSTAISAVTIHTVQGSYAGCISWFQNCAAGVSAHYVVRSSDGQVTQMVYEAQKAWHVGSENPYTVGIEHEGYVNNASWYTSAMYQSSADLTRNICIDNTIDPLRTGWWPWLATTYYNQSSIPGNCSKVKGHQHFPNQTHNDPGVNWDWNRYYQLINSTLPAATVYTAATGSFYDSGGQFANYGDDERLIWRIAPTNANSVTLNFSSFNLENTWDYLFIYDGNTTASPLIGSYTGTNNPGTITSSGGTITLEFRSDCATSGTGWAATWTSTSNVPNADNTAPTTTIAVNGSWQTANFSAAFTESDNAGGSGLEKSFAQVIDFDGADWRANATRGYFSDNFDQAALHPDWTAATGTWALTNGVLEQSDENLTNTNIHTALTQNLSNTYLYHWAGKIEGTGNNRRAGFHFFCDSAALTNRGNSYFVWFRADQSVCEFYEVINDVFSLRNSVAMTVTLGQWYDWKVSYDRTTGKMEVWQDNTFIGSWTDATPLSNGNAVSFRSGNCNWQINNFKVYRSRVANQPLAVSVGTCAGCELRYQNTNPSTPAGRIKSIVRDSANNLSAIAFIDVQVDWTAPTPVDTINDGPLADVDLFTSAAVFAANWSASADPHSGVAAYWYAIGTTPGDSDLVAWTPNWNFDTVALTNLTLLSNQWYYVSVRAENGAGLISNTSTSDGVLVDLTTGISMANSQTGVGVFPNPITTGSVLQIQQTELSTLIITLTDGAGRQISRNIQELPAGLHLLPISQQPLASGHYILTIQNAVGSLQLPLLVIE